VVLIPGLYESILTEGLRLKLEQVDSSHTSFLPDLQAEEAPDRLALHLSNVIEQVLAAIPADERARAGAALVGELIRRAVGGQSPELALEAPDAAAKVLSEIAARLPDGRPDRVPAPVVPLLDTALITHGPGEPRLLAQLLSEIPSAHGIDLIMAFIRRSGLAPMRDALRRHARDRGRALRVLTTVYTGSTEAAALEELIQLGAQIRVSYDTTTTRLHAKAWLFHRPHGVTTGYIGSSNLTHSAQVTGLEWNLRVSAARNRAVLERMQGLFESCWNSREFSDFDPVTFREVIRANQREGRTVVILPGIELRLEGFQERMLELIAIERARGRHRNLLVSATGTGKTVMAAVDYARLRLELPRARLLFVAHRKQILEQSRAMFRYALSDTEFGELWVDGERPNRFDHVFASVQSLSAGMLDAVAPDWFDVVIVDEFHHAAAPTYRVLLQHLRPRELLGLTATPERTDGESVLAWFDGRIAAELRLWDAIDQQRLVPFAYYGIADATDLSRIPWNRGRGYDASALTNVLTADGVWASFVLRALVDKVGDPSRMRALGFCVSIGHARFMANFFSEHGIAANAVTGESDSDDRGQALRDLAAGDLKILFSVDLFNEGLDLPAIDTLLMLRPTESPTLFIQQLGRGLRRHRGKAQCTVLDFVGQHHQKFSYAGRFRALLGGTRKQLIDQIEQGFPFLPSGCHLALEGVARERVLSSLRHAVPRGIAQMADALRMMRHEGLPLTLAEFLEHTGLEAEDVYGTGGRTGRSWSAILAAAGESLALAGPHETALRTACGRLLHVDDLQRLRAYDKWLARSTPPDISSLTAREIRWLRMLVAVLFQTIESAGRKTLSETMFLLWEHPQIVHELRELFGFLGRRVAHLGYELSDRPNVPLRVHARYSRVEIQAALGDRRAHEAEAASGAVPPWREGVKWMDAEGCDVLLITLNKTEKRFSPTTRYRDYAISRDLLHWESQSGTRASSPTGQRYQHHVKGGSSVMVFVRENAEERAFHFLGPATYRSHRGETPMQIVWQLSYPLPGDLFSACRAVAV